MPHEVPPLSLFTGIAALSCVMAPRAPVSAYKWLIATFSLPDPHPVMVGLERGLSARAFAGLDARIFAVPQHVYIWAACNHTVFRGFHRTVRVRGAATNRKRLGKPKSISCHISVRIFGDLPVILDHTTNVMMDASTSTGDQNGTSTRTSQSC